MLTSALRVGALGWSRGGGWCQASADNDDPHSHRGEFARMAPPCLRVCALSGSATVSQGIAALQGRRLSVGIHREFTGNSQLFG
eukprot:255675-Prorocentrum_minimum.AAC.2